LTRRRSASGAKRDHLAIYVLHDLNSAALLRP
jgi:hypothetical protein